MARIKVTAYVEFDDLEPGERDGLDDTGLTEVAFTKYTIAPHRLPLTDPEFELQFGEDE